MGHEFDLKIFVSAEDDDTMKKNERLYMELSQVGIFYDVRDFKHKSFICKCRQEGRQKVQAEVDVAIAVKMIDTAQIPGV